MASTLTARTLGIRLVTGSSSALLPPVLAGTLPANSLISAVDNPALLTALLATLLPRGDVTIVRSNGGAVTETYNSDGIRAGKQIA